MFKPGSSLKVFRHQGSSLCQPWHQIPLFRIKSRCLYKLMEITNDTCGKIWNFEVRLQPGGTVFISILHVSELPPGKPWKVWGVQVYMATTKFDKYGMYYEKPGEENCPISIQRTDLVLLSIVKILDWAESEEFCICKFATLHRLPVTDIERGLNKWLTDPLSLFLPLSLSCSAWYTMWQACGQCGARLIPVVRVLNITSVVLGNSSKTCDSNSTIFVTEPMPNTQQYLILISVKTWWILVLPKPLLN